VFGPDGRGVHVHDHTQRTHSHATCQTPRSGVVRPDYHEITGPVQGAPGGIGGDNVTRQRGARVPRPILLLLVYGALVFIVAAAAIAQVALVSAHVTASTLNAVVASDSGTIATFMNTYVAPTDLDPRTLAAARRTEIETRLGILAQRSGFLRIEIRSMTGQVLMSDRPEIDGAVGPASDSFAAATSGRTYAALSEQPGQVEAAGLPLTASAVMQEYLPLMSGDHATAVIGVWRDAATILDQLAAARRDVLFATLSAAFIAAAVLYLVFRSAQSRLSMQARSLVEATRRDPVTAMMNHGAMVEVLTDAVEAARRSGSELAIAHVDIDNFRLLNDNHGHSAADRALLEVGAILREETRPDLAVGRFGPDEFMIVAPTQADLDPVVAGLRTALAERSLQFESTERLPITVSVGLAAYPAHADSVTALLSTAAVALGRAKASGGDGVRGPEVASAMDAQVRTFNVLQGLVVAIDAKDRYTKRHSEEVAQYATFLADQLGLDGELRSALWTAGLLHDVGKIGLPDALLRKPGPLSDEEYEIVKQHVALGDSIVRTLPNAELAQSGVRHHHERWDGKGYLDRLSGEEIPLIARILAVGDAFSAMTTTRPYRKALTITEALRRLGDCAGEALDERLVKVFIAGIETADQPPLPGARVPAGTVWLPMSAIR
jgi:diguanylate cyclase (GGDEF)-like protein/putative nucleotidyltransferase with HDIG domain